MWCLDVIGGGDGGFEGGDEGDLDGAGEIGRRKS